MKSLKIRCPCCDNLMCIEIEDTGDVAGVFFDGLKISTNEAFEQYGICLGLKGGESIEK